MKLTAKSSGAEQVRGRLRSIQDHLASALPNIVQAGALPVVNEAQRLAPYKTGNLRRSIHSEITESSSTRAVASVGPDVDYAIYLEYGTRYMRARPYLRPAFESTKAEVQQTMTEAASEIITRSIT